ncbi:MAG: von Willebrand factor type A domain-containing protein, partial [Myxococcales bacterium]|nr:von Willebrand factor type A domain-containing protein [Myxococcales bacterium]
MTPHRRQTGRLKAFTLDAGRPAAGHAMSRFIRLLPLLAALAAVDCGGVSTRPAAPVEPTPPMPPNAPAALAFARLPVLDLRPPPALYAEHYGVNPTVDTEEEPVSRFGVDLDTAAYALARAQLEGGHLPDPAAVRVEAFINRFDSSVPAPTDQMFSVFTEVFPSPNRPGYHVLRLVLRGRRIPLATRPPVALTVVVDLVDGAAHLDRARAALDALIARLGPDDRLTLVDGAGEVVLPATPGDQSEVARAALVQLRPRGAAPLGAGVQAAMTRAADEAPDRPRRVLLLADRRAALGDAGVDALAERLRPALDAGVELSVVGFGLDRYPDADLARLARLVGGRNHYVDRLDEADRLLAAELAGARFALARDVRVELRFVPAQVARYRLIGYESRVPPPGERAPGGRLAAEDAVTALYEVKLRADRPAGMLASVRASFVDAADGRSARVEGPIGSNEVRARLEDATPSGRLALVAAAFGEKLRRAYWVRGVRYADLRAQLAALPGASRAPPRPARPPLPRPGHQTFLSTAHHHNFSFFFDSLGRS